MKYLSSYLLFNESQFISPGYEDNSIIQDVKDIGIDTNFWAKNTHDNKWKIEIEFKL